MTFEEMKALPKEEQKKIISRLSFERQKGKTTNYSATYGAGGAKIALAAGLTKAEGEALHKSYWDINWSIKAVADAVKTKNCLGQQWLFNPVSKFWYSLRHEKDKFSTLNQGKLLCPSL